MASLISDPVAANKVTSALKDVFKHVVNDVEPARGAAEDTFGQISELHSKLESDERMTGAQRNKLKQLYQQAISEADKVTKA